MNDMIKSLAVVGIVTFAFCADGSTQRVTYPTPEQLRVELDNIQNERDEMTALNYAIRDSIADVQQRTEGINRTEQINNETSVLAQWLPVARRLNELIEARIAFVTTRLAEVYRPNQETMARLNDGLNVILDTISPRLRDLMRRTDAIRSEEGNPGASVRNLLGIIDALNSLLDETNRRIEEIGRSLQENIPQERVPRGLVFAATQYEREHMEYIVDMTRDLQEIVNAAVAAFNRATLAR